MPRARHYAYRATANAAGSRMHHYIVPRCTTTGGGANAGAIGCVTGSLWASGHDALAVVQTVAPDIRSSHEVEAWYMQHWIVQAPSR